MNLPKVRNRVKVQYIDGTPKGYALRILEHYRARCDGRYVTSRTPKKGNELYDYSMGILQLMNEAQVERAKELDRAIEILRKGD